MAKKRIESTADFHEIEDDFGGHSLSRDCPCEPQVEQISERYFTIWHQPLGDE